MLPTHTRTFRIRHYECDGYGHLNHANYLRCMQETAFDASAAVGYDFDRYAVLGHTWLIRDTEIKYLAPLRYGDETAVKTWVLDMGRVRSRRAYEMTSVRTGDLCARATMDWVYLNTESLRPASIPPAMQAAFLPDGPPADAPARARFPGLPDPPPGVFTTRRRVEWRDIDPLGHVNNAVYLSYLEDAGMAVAEAFGWPFARMEAAGFGIVARHHRIEYRAPAVMGDEIEIATWISEVRAASVLRHFALTRPADGALIARAHTRWVWVDITTGHAMRIPTGFMDDFAANIGPRRQP
jgi:acyl-CoA thioester hydrolase